MNFINHKFKTKNGHIIHNKYIPLSMFDTCVYCHNMVGIILNKNNKYHSINSLEINTESKNFLPCLSEEEYIIKKLLE